MAGGVPKVLRTCTEYTNPQPIFWAGLGDDRRRASGIVMALAPFLGRAIGRAGNCIGHSGCPLVTRTRGSLGSVAVTMTSGWRCPPDAVVAP